MLRQGTVLVVAVGLLSACGHTPEERLVSGALIGGLVGATVGVVSDPHRHHHDAKPYHRHGRHGYRHRYDRRDRGGWRGY